MTPTQRIISLLRAELSVKLKEQISLFVTENRDTEHGMLNASVHEGLMDILVLYAVDIADNFTKEKSIKFLNYSKKLICERFEQVINHIKNCDCNKIIHKDFMNEPTTQ